MAVLAPRWGGVSSSRAEWLCALVLIGAVTAAGSSAARMYATVIAPSLPQPSVPAAPRGVRADDREAVERFQRVNDLLGEAVVYRNDKRQDWADEALAAVLALDPANPTAHELRRQWTAEPPLALTDTEAAARALHERRSELLGAAASLREAGLESEAALLIAEAAALG